MGGPDRCEHLVLGPEHRRAWTHTRSRAWPGQAAHGVGVKHGDSIFTIKARAREVDLVEQLEHPHAHWAVRELRQVPGGSRGALRTI